MKRSVVAALVGLALSWSQAHAQATEDSTPGTLEILDMTPGTGATAVENASVTVHYTGWLLDGTKFDSSHDRKQPFTFTLGAGRVIRGWDLGVKGMKVGGTRELTIPPDLGYGESGAGGVIPPNATLRFEVELLAVAPPKFKAIGNEDLKGLMQRGVTVLDIRRPDEWVETGTIPGVQRLTAFDKNGQFVPTFPDALDALIDRDAEVVLICRTGRRSLALARAMADQAGFTRVYSHATGMEDWIEAGNRVEK